MKLSLTVPERPGMIYFLPGFDLLTLVLALVMLTGVVAKESYVDISLPHSEFRGKGLGDEQPVIVGIRYSGKGPTYYVDRNPVEEADLKEAILEETSIRSTRLVILRIDQNAPLWVKYKMTDLCTQLDLTCKEAVNTTEIKSSEK